MLLAMLRPFFPSWRFYEDIGYEAELFSRVIGVDGAPGPWERVLRRSPRTPWMLLYNARVNQRHASDSLLEHLHQELAQAHAQAHAQADAKSPEQVSGSVRYLLARDLVRHHLGGEHPTGTRFQFKLDSVMQGAPEDRIEDVLVSEVHEV